MANSSAMDLTRGRPIRQILLFSMPLVAGTLFQQLYSFVDTVMVGRLIGDAALAAVGTTYSLNFLTLGFVQGACVGFAIPLAQATGAKDQESFRRYFWNGAWLCVLLGVVLTAGTFILAEPLLRLIHTPEEILADAIRYIQVIFLGIPATILYNFCAGVLRAAGDSRRPTLFLFLSSVLNVILDYFLIAVIPMGVAGAALATVLSQLVSGLLNLGWICGRTALLRNSAGLRGISGPHIAKLCRVGFPMGFEYSVSALGAVIMQGAINGLGTAAIAGQTASEKIRQMFTLPMESVGMGMATYAGQNDGAGRYDRIRAGIKAGLTIQLIYCAAAWVVILMGKEFFTGIVLCCSLVGGVPWGHQLPVLYPRQPDDYAQHTAGHGLQPARCPQWRGRIAGPDAGWMAGGPSSWLFGNLLGQPVGVGICSAVLHGDGAPFSGTAAAR